MVWDGDQLLYEISAPGASGTTANAQHTAVAGWFPYGRVMYEHGGGIDAPLGVVRMEFSELLHDPQVIFPFHTWRGSYDGGVTQGQCAYYTTNGTQLAPAPDSMWPWPQLFHFIPAERAGGAVVRLLDGAHLPASELLERAMQYLGDGYRGVEPSRFVSADGERVRMRDSDILGKH